MTMYAFMQDTARERYSLELVGREIVADKTILLHFKKPDGFSYEAGQTMRLSFPDTDTSKPFSLVSAPYEDDLQFAMRLSGSDFKKKIECLRVGNQLEATGPFGEQFTLDDDVDRPAIFIAGGIGITPLFSLLKQIVHTGKPYQVTLFYANRRKNDRAFSGELATLAKEHPTIKVVETLTRKDATADGVGEVGRIDPEMIARHTDYVQPVYYIVGTPDMVLGVTKKLEKAGVPRDDMVIKKFNGYPVATTR